MSGFLLKFLSRIGGTKGKKIVQQYTQRTQFITSRHEAFDKLAEQYPSVMRSNDPDRIRRLLETANIAAEFNPKQSYSYISNLKTKLQEIEKETKNRNTPTF